MKEMSAAETWEMYVANSIKVNLFSDDSILLPEVPLRSEVALRGALWLAAQTLVDELFGDVEAMRGATDVSKTVSTKTRVLAELPEKYSKSYDALFAQKFLVATVDLTSRLSTGWRRLGCTAQEFGFRFLLDEVRVLEGIHELTLPEDWRRDMEELYYEDTDFVAHYNLEPASDPNSVYELYPVERWFQPFDVDVALPPYIDD